jgi:hypothetical protein
MVKGLAIAVCAVLALTACAEWEKLDYEEANIALWHTLPVYPGAVIYGQGNSEYRDGEEGPVIGWTTDVTYDVPQGTTAEEVIAFYVEALGSEWAHCETNIEPSLPSSGEGEGTPAALVETFVQAGASVMVGTLGLADPTSETHRYQLSVDHAAKVDACAG